MKAVAVNGSPRKGGNTEILLRKVLEPLTSAGWDTEFRGGWPGFVGRSGVILTTWRQGAREERN